jgi:hypothetical protein
VSCDECVEVFSSGLDGIALQIEVDKRFPEFVCEECSISGFSPGKVESGESVVFLTIHPIHYDPKTGLLSPVAFEQLTRNDLSLLRQKHTTRGEFDLVLSSLAGRGSGKIERSIDHCCLVKVDAIRGAKDEDGRVFGVYDTAIEELPAHASVFVRKDYLNDKAGKLEARRLALSIFEPHLALVDDVKPPAAA